MRTNELILDHHSGKVNTPMGGWVGENPAVNYTDLLSTGIALLAGRVSVIPVTDDKTPALKEWTPYQTRLATNEELTTWCKKKSVHGLAMIGGQASGGLVDLDFDAPGFFERFIEKVSEHPEVRELPYILPTQQTGSGNYQMAFRCGLSLKSDKLAWIPADNKQGREAAIETRAAGGYAVIAPSFCPEAKKHGIKHKQAYRVIQGDFAKIPTITDRQASILLELARSLDAMPPKSPKKKEMKAAPLPPNRSADGNGGGVIAAFNRVFDIRTILERNRYERQGKRHLAPDSTTGLAGVYIFEDTGRCFSHHANDPLNDTFSHDAFDVHLIVKHGDNMRAAIKDAVQMLGPEAPPFEPQAPPAKNGGGSQVPAMITPASVTALPDIIDAIPAWPHEVMTGGAGVFARAYANCLEPPASFFYMNYLTVLGHVLSGKVTLQSELRPQTRLYVCDLGESADTRKSTAITKVSDFFAGVIDSGDLHLVFGVGSAEGLASAMERKPKAILISDEFNTLVQKMQIQGSVLLPCICTLFESNRFHNHTKKGEMKIDDAELCLLAASTLDTYRSMFTAKYIDIGFINRLFVVIGDSERKFSIPQPMPTQERDSLKSDLQEILTFVGTLTARAGGCYAFPIEPEAMAIFDKWYFSLEKSVFIKRLDTYGHRLMPLLAVNEMKESITPEIAQRTITLLNYQLKARKFCDPIDADSRIAALEARIGRLLENGPMLKRDLERHAHKMRTGIWAWEAALKNLRIQALPYEKTYVYKLPDD